MTVEPLEGRALFTATGLSRGDESVVLSADRGLTVAPSGAKTPAQIRSAFGLTGLTFGNTAATGAGETIAIIDAYDAPTALTDLNAFSAAFGLPAFNSGAGSPTFKKVNENGGSSLPRTDPSGAGDSWAVETSLDIEWAHAIAPEANIVLVEASSTSSADLIRAAVGWARSASGIDVVSMSFGGDEDASETAYDSVFTTPSGHNGVTFVASAGDDGGISSYPAASKNVLAVGGTHLTLNADGTYAGESGWSDGGGGVSPYESQPTYQSGVVTQTSSRRATPDVAWLADPSSGVALYDAYDFGTSTPWLAGYEGGTSLAAPMWAGLLAVADQGRALNGLGSLDGPTAAMPALYALPQSDFHDVTAGNNGAASAGVGYDLVTGRGSPTAQLVLDLANYGKPATAVTGSISGLTFNDTDGDGVFDAGETVGSGKTIYLDANNNGKLDAGEQKVVTGANGTFSFTGLAAGTYHVRRVFPTGYTQSTAVLDVTLTAGQVVSGLQIGSKAASAVAVTAGLGGFTFDDTNANGAYDAGEARTAGKLVFLDTDNDGVLDAGEKSTKTAADGSFSFTGLAPGTYHVRRVFPTGWTASTAPIDVTLTAGQTLAGLIIGSRAK